MDRPRKAVPDKLFYKYTLAIRQGRVYWYSIYTNHTQRLQHHDSTMQVFLKRSYLKMHIFSKITNDVGVLKQRLVSTSNTSVTALHSLSKKNWTPS